MRRELTQDDLSFRFHVRNVVDIACRVFLDTDQPEEIVLAILGNPDGDPPEVIVRRILRALTATIKDELALGRFLRQLEVLSKLHHVQDEVIKQIEAMYDLETDIRYLQGQKKGAEEALTSRLIRGRQEAKREDVRGLLRLGVLTNQQIATALGVTLEYVLTVQAGLTNTDPTE